MVCRLLQCRLGRLVKSRNRSLFRPWLDGLLFSSPSSSHSLGLSLPLVNPMQNFNGETSNTSSAQPVRHMGPPQQYIQTQTPRQMAPISSNPRPFSTNLPPNQINQTPRHNRSLQQHPQRGVFASTPRPSTVQSFSNNGGNGGGMSLPPTTATTQARFRPASVIGKPGSSGASAGPKRFFAESVRRNG